MIQNIRRSLTDLLGAEYTAAVCRARAALTGESPEALRAVADELETLVAREYWPFPTYGDLLFGVV